LNEIICAFFNKEGFFKKGFLEHNTRLDTDIRERDYKDAFFGGGFFSIKNKN